MNPVSRLGKYIENDVQRDPEGVYSLVPALCAAPTFLVAIILFLFDVGSTLKAILLGLALLLAILGLSFWFLRFMQNHVRKIPADLLSSEYRKSEDSDGR